MRRFLVVGGFLAFGVLLTALSFIGLKRDTRGEIMVRDRGQTQTLDPAQTLNRGRFFSQPAVAPAPQLWTGMLVDAGCPNREAAAFTPPQARLAQPGTAIPQPIPPRVGAPPARVQPRAAAPELADALAQLVPDVASRQMDSACSITGNTRGFALLTDDGQMKNFDEGGNTLALEAWQASPGGRAVLNGRSPGDRPRVEVRATVRGDKLLVDAVRVL